MVKKNKTASAKPGRTNKSKTTKSTNKPAKTYESLNKIYQGLINQQQKLDDKIIPLEDKYYKLRAQWNDNSELYSHKKDWFKRSEKIASSLDSIFKKLEPLQSQRKVVQTKINSVYREMQIFAPACGPACNHGNTIAMPSRGRLFR